MHLERQLDKRQIVALLFSNERYQNELAKLIKFSAEHGKKICYVSLNMTHHALAEIFKQCKVDPKKFFIVDAVTPTVMIPKPVEGVSFVTNPCAATELGIQIGKAYEENKFDLMLFDSLSTLMGRAQGLDVMRFVHALTTRIRVFKSRAIFPILRDDMDSMQGRDLSMFVDAVIDATVESMMWQRKLKKIKAAVGAG